MHVEMGHALADAIIHRHESSVRFHGNFNRARQELHVFEVRLNLLERQVSQSFTVFLGNYQAMAGKNRAMVEKCDRVLVFKHNPGDEFARDDFAEETSGLGHLINTGL